MKIAFTGHRPSKLGNDYELKSPLVEGIRQTIIKDILELETSTPPEFFVGGALGIDTLAALIAIDMHIPYTLVVPCMDQQKAWPMQSQRIWNYIKNKATRVVYVSNEPYTNWCMQKRNEWMVDQLTGPDDFLYAVWDGTPGGTSNCIKYAQRVGVEIHLLKL